MTSPTSHGRGAWTTVCKSNGSRVYEYIAGKPMDGFLVGSGLTTAVHSYNDVKTYGLSLTAVELQVLASKGRAGES